MQSAFTSLRPGDGKGRAHATVPACLPSTWAHPAQPPGPAPSSQGQGAPPPSGAMTSRQLCTAAQSGQSDSEIIPGSRSYYLGELGKLTKLSYPHFLVFKIGIITEPLPLTVGGQTHKTMQITSPAQCLAHGLYNAHSFTNSILLSR